MNKIRLASLGLLLLLSADISTLASNNSKLSPTPAPKIEKRVIDFRSKVSLGGISLAKLDGPDGYHQDKAQLSAIERKFVCPAMGKQTIEVPSDQYLCFEPNRRLIDEPKIFGSIDPGIDALFLKCSSFDDTEAGRSDNAFGCVHLLKGIKELYIDQSEVTDKAISRMPIIDSLRLFSAFLVTLNGSCLQRLSQQPNIRCLMLWNTKINSANYKYLPSFRKLVYLDLDDNWMNHEAMSYVGKCTALKELSLRWNKTIVDDDIKCLSSLKNLETLDLRRATITDKSIPTLRRLTHLRELILAETGITADGAADLSPLHLEKLVLPDHHYSRAQRQMVEKICDHVSWDKSNSLGPQKVDRDTEKLFAPISKHRNL